MRYKTFSPSESLPQKNILFPQQTHSSHIVTIVQGDENLQACDGLFCRDISFFLGIQTADCAPVIFQGKKCFGIAHCGWRGLVRGILENMQDLFKKENDPIQKIWIGPLFPVFIIQRDFCFEEILQKFGEQFFSVSKEGEEEYLTFSFLEAIKSIVPKAEYCGENTFSQKKWASWRREGNSDRNRTIIGDW